MSELSHKDWMVKAAAIRFRDKAFIDGQFVAARSGRTFASINPATGETLAEVASCGEEEAIRIANDSIYGLAASLWTDSLSRAHRISERLRAGTVSVNTVDALSPMTPFGGFKQSGFGRDLSLHSFDKYTALKTTWIKY